MLCRGAVPQQTRAQSVHSSGRDERRGLGGNATTHFTGKSGSGSKDTPRLLLAFLGVLCAVYFDFFWVNISRHMRSAVGASCCVEQTEAESRICSAFNISNGPSTCSQTKPATSAVSCPAVLPPLPGLEDLGQYCGTLRTRR